MRDPLAAHRARVDQAFEAKHRIPGMRRDDDESPISGQHAAYPGERGRLIGKMFKHADEQDEFKLIAAIHAEIRCIANSKPQRCSSRVPSSACDHRGADIDADPKRDAIGNVKQCLPRPAAEIEHTRSMQIAAKRTQISNAGRKFRRARRSRTLLRIPDFSDRIEPLAHIRQWFGGVRIAPVSSQAARRGDSPTERGWLSLASAMPTRPR
jgi:hypothetical protein